MANVNVPVRNGQLIAGLAQLSAQAIGAMEVIPGLVERILRERMWEHYTVKGAGHSVSFLNFEDFVEAPFPDGLGMDIETLMRLCADKPEIVQMIQDEIG